jgi:hypothetical protein
MNNDEWFRSRAKELYHEEVQIEIDRNAGRWRYSLANSILSWRRSACGRSKTLTPLITRVRFLSWPRNTATLRLTMKSMTCANVLIASKKHSPKSSRPRSGSRGLHEVPIALNRGVYGHSQAQSL